MEKKHEFYLLFVLLDNGWQALSVHFIFEDAYFAAVKKCERAKKDCDFVVRKFSVEGDFLPKLEHLLDSKFTLYYSNED